MPHLFHNPIEAVKKITPHNIKVTINSMKPEEISAASPYIDNEWWNNEWERIIKNRTMGFIYLLNNYPVDIALLCYKALDCIQHRMFHISEEIEKWYKIQDEEIEKLIKGLNKKPKSITILSDHGFVLKHHGYLTGDHKPIGMFVSNIKNNVKDLIGAHNFILKLR